MVPIVIAQSYGPSVGPIAHFVTGEASRIQIRAVSVASRPTALPFPLAPHHRSPPALSCKLLGETRGVVLPGHEGPPWTPPKEDPTTCCDQDEALDKSQHPPHLPRREVP